MPSNEELRALELSLAFASIDRNPRRIFEETDNKKQEMRTTENAELHLWPVGDGNVTINTGYLIPNCIVDATANPIMRPPLDLHMPGLAPTPDSLMLTGIYETVLGSLRSPGENSTADKIRVAVEWLAKAWSNTRAVQWPERLVYLKMAFEALTGTSTSWKSARKLREIFEALPHTTERDSEILVWSPEEKPVHTRKWVDKCGQSQSTLITDLEYWFMAFGKARNTIIHEGRLPEPAYSGSNPAYDGPFIFTAEFLLRGVIKVLLTELSHENAWRSELRRFIDVTWAREDD